MVVASGDEAVLQRLDALIAKGNAVQNTGSQDRVQPGPFHGWRAQALSTLERTVGSNDAYHCSFVAEVNRTWKSKTAVGVAILQALRDDVQAGYLTKLTDLVVAAVFTDFIAMAHHLLREGYKDPAASLTGAVLEDGLRKLATRAGVTFAASDGIDALNRKCAGAGAYSPLKQSQIDTWRLVRNEADHGHLDAYAADDVAAMIIGVQALLADHL